MNSKEIEKIQNTISNFQEKFEKTKGINNKRIYNMFGNLFRPLTNIKYKLYWTEEEEQVLSEQFNFSCENSIYTVKGYLQLTKNENLYKFITWGGVRYSDVKICKTFDEVINLLISDHFRNFDKNKYNNSTFYI